MNTLTAVLPRRHQTHSDGLLSDGLLSSTEAHKRARSIGHPTLKHPTKFVRARAQQIGTSLLWGHLAVLTVVALYFIFFESSVLNFVPHLFSYHHTMKYTWDHLFSTIVPWFSSSHWSYYRHLLFRNGAEAFLASLFVQQMLFNPYRPKVDMRLKFQANLRKPFVRVERTETWWDRVEQKLGVPNFWEPVKGWQVALCGVYALIYALPGIGIGLGIVYLLHHALHVGALSTTLSAHPSFAAKLYADGYDEKVVAFIAGIFMARRPMKPVYRYIMRYFAERRVALGKKAHFYHTRAFAALVYEIRASEGQEAATTKLQHKGTLVPLLLSGGLLVMFGLAVYGAHVLAVYAT